MTALTTPALPKRDERLRPVPWRRMAWITWRQHRLALAGVTALLGALGVLLWNVGLQLHQAYAAATACHPASSIACGELTSSFNGMNQVLRTGYVLLAVPALIGAFVGAPVLARELETGTFRYAWTQGFGRRRWTLAKLVLLAVVVAAASGALSVLFSWFYQPYVAAGNQTRPLSALSPLDPGIFNLRGVALPAWTLAAFAMGGLAGMLIRQVVSAIVVTLAAYAGLALAAGMFLRQHYLTPLVTSRLDVPASAWITSQWWTKGDRFAFAGPPPINLLQQFCPPSAVGPGKPSMGTLAQCLSQHGYTQWTSYQPASRFWTFQGIEGAWLFLLSLLLVTGTVWLVQRRAI